MEMNLLPRSPPARLFGLGKCQKQTDPVLVVFNAEVQEMV